MLKIKDALDEIIFSSPFLEEAIAYWYLNISSFSEYIKPQVESMTKKSVTLASLKMALSRTTLRNNKRWETTRFNAKNFFLRKGIEMVTFAKTSKNYSHISTLSKQTEQFPDEYLAIIRGMNEVDIIFGEKLADLIQKNLQHESIKLHITDCAIIGINLDDTMLQQPGIFYTVAKKLYLRNINILQIISTYHELSIVLKSPEIKKAFEILTS